MLEYLIQLSAETLGQNMLGYLELIDIIRLENAASSHKSQQLVKEMLLCCPPLSLEHFEINRDSINWLAKRRCCVQHATIPVDALCEVDIQHNAFDNIELCLNFNTSMQHIDHLKNPFINQKITSVKIKDDQDPTVMEVLFTLLSNSDVSSLDIQTSNQYEWVEPIRKIGTSLRELSIENHTTLTAMINTLVKYCPNLEKLSLNSEESMSEINILQSIANNCPYLRYLFIYIFAPSHAEADSDLTAFAEKCPQLEELSLFCEDLTDQSVISLAQHCSRLKKLKLDWCELTAASMIALSERSLPLEELDIPAIPIFSTDIATQCAHALSRIRALNTFNNIRDCVVVDYHCAIQYMTGLREVELGGSEDHLLVPHLLLLGHCVGLESLIVGSDSSITTEQLSELVLRCSNLHTLYIDHSTYRLLVAITHGCPRLQNVRLNSSEVTEEGVLALAVHCRQLRAIDLHGARISERTVRQLAKHCRHLTVLQAFVQQGDNIYTRKKLSKRDIRLYARKVKCNC